MTDDLKAALAAAQAAMPPGYTRSSDRNVSAMVDGSTWPASSYDVARHNLDVSLHNVGRANFDRVPVKARKHELDGRPYWSKTMDVRRNGHRLRLEWYCDEPPVANQGANE